MIYRDIEWNLETKFISTLIENISKIMLVGDSVHFLKYDCCLVLDFSMHNAQSSLQISVALFPHYNKFVIKSDFETCHFIILIPVHVS